MNWRSSETQIKKETIRHDKGRGTPLTGGVGAGDGGRVVAVGGEASIVLYSSGGTVMVQLHTQISS